MCRDILAFAHRIGAISAYAYLGDIAESVTGDKKAQRFEDGYLEELFQVIRELGFQAVTYMPNRNTPAQLERVQALCARHELLQVSGVDINSPRQSFACPQLRQPQFRHLVEATWALIGHELEASEDPARGLFAPETLRRTPALAERVTAYAALGGAWPPERHASGPHRLRGPGPAAPDPARAVRLVEELGERGTLPGGVLPAFRPGPAQPRAVSPLPLPLPARTWSATWSSGSAKTSASRRCCSGTPWAAWRPWATRFATPRR